jgi:hypothetical protein
MPTSCPRQIPFILKALLDIKPAPLSLVDVGMGCGKYGLLAREYLTVWDHYFEEWGSVPLHLAGIEYHPLYIGPTQRAIYDEIHIGDALGILPTLGRFDAALLVDTLEHFDHRAGERLLEELGRHVRETIIGIPAVFRPTLPVWGNDLEVHKCAWVIAEFEWFGDVQVYRNDDALVLRLTHRGGVAP